MRKCAIITLLPICLFTFYSISNSAFNLTWLLVSVTFIAMVALYIFFASDKFVRRLNNYTGTIYWKKVIFIVAIFLLYTLYVVGTGPFPKDVMVKTAVYLGFPVIVLATLKETKQYLIWQDFLVIIGIWFPVEFDWFNLGRGGILGSADDIITKLVAIDATLFVFLIIRRLEGIGYKFSLKKQDFLTILVCYIAIGVIVIPIGLATDFLGFTPHLPGLEILMIEAIGIFFAIGLVEEILFRGIIHNLIQKSLSGKFGTWKALVISSVIFGAAHLNNMGGGDMRYFFLATIAGGFYGLAYIRSGNIIPAAMVHTLIDLTWVLFFSK